MRTVKEVSGLTGVSVRTLHYYDEIGLLRPTQHTESGYRLYDDKALEMLQQILFFREFGIPLKDIKKMMDNPGFDKESILNSQKKILELERDRLERLISSIDDSLKGVNNMNFEVFDKREIQQLYQTMMSNMKEAQIDTIIQEYGDLDRYQQHFMENAGSVQAQKNFGKVVEWYGGKENAVKAAHNPQESDILQAYQKRIDRIYKDLAGKMGLDVNELEVKELVGEYDFVSRQLYQMDDVTKLLLEMSEEFQHNEDMRISIDRQYGKGAAAYIGRAIESFYRK